MVGLDFRSWSWCGCIYVMVGLNRRFLEKCEDILALGAGVCTSFETRKRMCEMMKSQAEPMFPSLLDEIAIERCKF